MVGGTAAEITSEEIARELKKMCKRKAADLHGLVVECFQEGGDHLNYVLAELFADVLKWAGTLWCQSIGSRLV